MTDADQPIARRLAGTAVNRPRSAPPPGVPVALRSVQHVHVSPGRFEPPTDPRIVLIKWTLTGQSALGIADRRIPFAPGQVAVHLPSSPHQFWAHADPTELAWFSLDGPLVEQFVLHLELAPGVYPWGPAPLADLHQMMDTLRDPSPRGQRRASLLAIALLYRLADARRSAPDLPEPVRHAQHLIQQHFADPNLSTDAIAAQLHYHRGSLSRLFHHHTGLTLIDSITQVRLQHARTLLAQSPDSISQIAAQCGFRDPTYFSRWLRKHTHHSPRALRALPQP